MLGWCLALTGVMSFIVSTRTPGFLGMTLATLTVVMVIYAFIPLPVLFQAIPGAGMSAANFGFVAWSTPTLDRASLTTFGVMLLIVNLLGATTSIHEH